MANVTTVSDETRTLTGSKFQMTALEMVKSLMLRTVLVLRKTSFWVSAHLRCHLLVTDEISTQPSVRYDGTNHRVMYSNFLALVTKRAAAF